MRPRRARLQMIFQDTHSALNPRHRIGDIVAQPLVAFRRVEGALDARRRAAALLERVGLAPALAVRYPHEVSGGQRQRIGIARAIALEPALIVADEIVSGLDVSTQAQILDLLRDLKRDLDLALVFISHDLSVVRVLCERLIVLLHGEVVERGSCADVFERPRHPYTRDLLAAIPLPEVDPDWLHAGMDDGGGSASLAAAEGEGEGMKIAGSVALVTGANGGIGTELVRTLVARGAAKVYAAARDIEAVTQVAALNAATVEAVGLDVTDPEQLALAAKSCSDVTLLINNAGVNHNTGLIGATNLDNARQEMEVNYFGTLGMCRAFAPVLKANGGGVIANILSITARANLPLMGSLCASKAAALSMTQGVRAELAAQGTRVIAIMPGATDTRMSTDFPPPKMPPSEVAAAALNAVEGGLEEIYPGDMASGIAEGLAADPKAVEKELSAYLPE